MDKLLEHEIKECVDISRIIELRIATQKIHSAILSAGNNGLTVREIKRVCSSIDKLGVAFFKAVTALLVDDMGVEYCQVEKEGAGRSRVAYRISNPECEPMSLRDISDLQFDLEIKLENIRDVLQDLGVTKKKATSITNAIKYNQLWQESK